MGGAARFVVGIDLGTTNTVVAFAPREGGSLATFEVPQRVSAGEVEARPLLPSCLYAPLPHELSGEDSSTWIVGEFARRRGVEAPSRVVLSSKSWLSHARVDRLAPILPWRAGDEGEDAPRISPVDAAACVLSHVRSAWDEAHLDARLADQDVVLTVPASFDDTARELTLEAAKRAGLTVRLLEEPQAAFYELLNRAPPERIASIVDASGGGEAIVLVCDIGGGTTDFSLVSLRKGASQCEAARVAVGRHLLLGGDNMDLALARAVEVKLAQSGGPERLDAVRFGQLTLACRSAKEKLLGDPAPESVPIRLLARGAALIGATLASELSRAEVESTVLGGFFPDAARDDKPQGARSGLVAFGLPFERDAAITRHAAHFFARHAGELRGPHAVLLNGGVFLAKGIESRFVETLARWGGPAIDVLPHDDPDLAVAHGAVRYGLARLGIGQRIASGAARGYYVGLAAEEPLARSLVCVVPRGAKEGVVHAARGRAFALKIGRPVRFDLFASDEADHAPGAVVSFDETRFDAMPPAFVAFESAGAPGPEIEVEIEGELTPVGTLDLACVSRASTTQSEQRFRLAFDLHADASPDAQRLSSLPPPSLGRANAKVKDLVSERRASETHKLGEAREAIERVYGKGRTDVAARQVKDLVRDLEKTLGERANWTTETARALADVLISNVRSRRRSADHERVYWMLTGYCLRPGFGDPNDGARVGELSPLFEERLAFADDARGLAQFWIAWRRVAGGLEEAAQTRIRDITDPFLAPAEKRLKKPKGWKGEPLSDVLDLASSLERVSASRRAELGGFVLERTWTDRDPRLWAAMGRIGAREPAYASPHHVVSPLTAERWIDHLLREKWEAPRGSVHAVAVLQRTAMELARMTGDRARDVSESARREVERRLVATAANEVWVQAVREVIASDESERAAFFGESLPLGLRLVR